MIVGSHFVHSAESIPFYSNMVQVEYERFYPIAPLTVLQTLYNVVSVLKASTYTIEVISSFNTYIIDY